MNQLDILLADYIQRFWDFDKIEILNFRKKIQNEHLRILKNHKGIIITDFKEYHISKKESFKKVFDLIHIPLPSGSYSSNWIWKFDNHDRYVEGVDIEMEVVAISF